MGGHVFRLAISTSASRVLGLIRSMIQARYLGTGPVADAFNFAFTIPNLMRRLAGEGAIASSFIPIYMEYHHDPEKARQFAGRFFGLSFSFLFLTVILVWLAAPALEYFNGWLNFNPRTLYLSVDLLRWMYPYALFICLAALLQGVLNSHHSFVPSSLSPILFNLIFIAAGLFIAPFFEGAGDHSRVFAGAVLIGGLAQLGIQIPFIRVKGAGFRVRFDFWRNPQIRRALKLFTLGAFGAGIYQVNVFLNRWIAMSSGVGVVSYLTYSHLLSEVVQGIIIISLTTVLLPSLTRSIQSGDLTESRRNLLFSLRVLLMFTLPAAVGLIMAGPEIITVLFQRGVFNEESVRGTYRALMIHSIGLPLVAAHRVISQIYYASKKIRYLVWVSFFSMLINITLAIWWSGPYREQGIALAGVVANAFALLFLFRTGTRLLNGLGVLKLLVPALRFGLGALVMVWWISFYRELVPPSGATAGLSLWLTGLVISCLFFYFAVVFLTNPRELGQLRDRLKRR